MNSSTCRARLGRGRRGQAGCPDLRAIRRFGPGSHQHRAREAPMLGTGDWLRQARHPAPHPCATLEAAGCPPDIRHGKDQTARRTGSLTRPVPNPGGAIQATRHRGHPATPPGTLEPWGPPPGWDGAVWRSHRCWSSGPAPRCKSGVSPGPEGTGQRALPRCKTGPSHRQGDGTEEEPQGQSSWLARGVLKRGAVISRQSQGRRGGRGRGMPPALPSSFHLHLRL